jgi:putative ATPase
MASEDVGLGDPAAMNLAVSTMQGCQMIGRPECNVLLAQCAVYLARAKKSHEVYHAMDKVIQSIR